MSDNDVKHSTADWHYMIYRTAVGEAGQHERECDVIRRFGCTREFARYWRQRYADPTLHSGTWGGARHMTFNDNEQRIAETLLWGELQFNPQRKVEEFPAALMELYGLHVSKSWVQRCLARWRWTAKKPSLFAINKYTQSNMIYYGIYVTSVIDIAHRHLKFLDETHFDARRLKRTSGFSKHGTRIYGRKKSIRGDNALTMTIITNLHTANGFVVSTPHRGKNNAWAFASFVIDCLLDGSLVRGDYLICDNAKTHKADDMLDVLEPILAEHGVTLRFLPTYSPELNPCELVFSQIKRWIRNNHRDGATLMESIITAILQITPMDVLNYYNHCLFGFM